MSWLWKRLISFRHCIYTQELENTFSNLEWTLNLNPHAKLEQKIEDFFQHSNQNWRGGHLKSSFTYLLLDPRVTLNLPRRASSLSSTEIWRTFVHSIFYVGKGKRARPYAHLHKAVTYWNNPYKINRNQKIKHILDIWFDQYGVVCLHIFQNLLSVEAYIREASMIQVLGLENLRNVRSGQYYGIVKDWSNTEKCMLGLFLLYKALQIYLNEGERQLHPDDID